MTENNSIIITHSLDDNYAQHTAVTMASIKANKKNSTKIKTYLLYRELNPQNIKKLKSLATKDYEINFIKIDNTFSKAPTIAKLPEATYYRLLIHKLLPEFDKILYLDGDTVITGDLLDLYNIDIGDNYIAAVQSPGAFKERILEKTSGEKLLFLDYLADLGMNKEKAPDYYINAGVSLLNTKKMREENIEENFFEVINRVDFLAACDQDVINAVFDEKKIILDLTWNFQTPAFYIRKIAPEVINWLNTHKNYSDQIDKYIKELPRIIHYVFHKPWNNSTCISPYDYLYFKYLLLTPWRYNAFSYVKLNSIFFCNKLKKYFSDLLKNQINYFSIKKEIKEDKNLKFNFNEFKNNIQNKSVCFYGAGIWSRAFINSLDLSSLNIIGFIDKHKAGSSFNNYSVYSPDDIVKLKPDIIVISMQNNKGIFDYLYNIKIQNNLGFDIFDNQFNELSHIQFAGQALKKIISDYSFESVLDIGCGDGAHSDEFIKAKKNVTAIDYGESIYFKNNKDKLNTIIADFNEHEFNETYDCVWCSHVLEHQLNPNLFLKKIHSVLKENGLLAITVPPAKDIIVGGHVSLWNAGLLLYNLVIAGFDCSNAKVKKYDYNISIILRKKSIEVTQLLQYDTGDIKTIKNFLPKELEYIQSQYDSPFDGKIENINWEKGDC